MGPPVQFPETGVGSVRVGSAAFAKRPDLFDDGGGYLFLLPTKNDLRVYNGYTN